MSGLTTVSSKPRWTSRVSTWLAFLLVIGQLASGKDLESLIQPLIDGHRGERIAVVCHGGVINAYLAHVLGLGGEMARGFFYPNYTSIHRVAAASSGERSVVTINETSHLRGTGLPIGLFQRS